MTVPGMADLLALRDETRGLTDCRLAEVAADRAARRVTLRLLDVPTWDEAAGQQGIRSAEVVFSDAQASWVARGAAARDEPSAPRLTEPFGAGVRLDPIRSRLSEGRLTLDGLHGPSIGIVFGSAEVRRGPTTVLFAAGPDAPVVLHATTVAWEGRAVMIRGASGSGKSGLGLELLAWGCTLVADDRTELWVEAGRLRARGPAAIRGLIEARGVGILRAEATEEADVVMLADLDREETERLPPWHEETILGIRLPVLHKPLNGPFAAALLQYLRGGRASPAPEDGP